MKLALLDRDGVLNVDLPESVRSPEELELIPGAGEAVALLNESGYRVAIVTNQSVVGRGIITEEELKEIHQKLLQELAKEGGRVQNIFFCPDHPDQATIRRKPSPGMLIEAMNHYRTEEKNTIMIGDSLRDIQAAQAAGCRGILVKTGKGEQTLKEGLPGEADTVDVYDDLLAAVKSILGNDS